MGITIAIWQGYHIRNAEEHLQKVLKLQCSLDITAEANGISLRSINPRASHRLQPIFIALEVLRNADGLCIRNRSHLSRLQEDSVEWPNVTICWDPFGLKRLPFPKGKCSFSLYSSLSWFQTSGGGCLWSFSMLLLECCTVKEAFQALENHAGQKSFTRHSEARWQN